VVEEGPQILSARSSPWLAVLTLEAGQAPGQYLVPNRYLYALRSATWTGPALVQTSGALFVDQDRWLVANGSPVLETTDRGENWHAMGVVPAGRLVESLTMVDHEYGWAVLFSTPSRFGPVASNGPVGANGLARTADGGRTWTLVRLPS
jgi:hypothetical protein